tara:strand:- start:538 stop:1020 length:483 start_codon:yes stop_codon:yes gene_type:complete
MRKILFIVIISSFLGACTLTSTGPNEQGPKQGIGTVTGMVLGGKIANDFAKGSKNENIWTLAGVTLGAFMGNEIGAALDQQDLIMAQKTQYQALEYNKVNVRSTWSNPDTGNSGKIYPTRTFNRGEQPCREFTQEITIAGETETAFGIACRMADGSWQLQ